MKVTVLYIRNFYRVRELELRLSDPYFHLVHGGNGVGKSTIFEALCWCLFGRTARGRKSPGDDVINPEVGEDCVVGVALREGTREYRVERVRKGGKDGKESSLSISWYDSDYEGQGARYGEKHDLRGKDTKDSEKAIRDILGLDFETYTRTVYFPQEGVPSFGTLTDKAMKELFVEKFLDISWIMSCYEAANAEFKDISKELLSLDTEVGLMERTLEDQKRELSDLQRVVEDIKRGRKKKKSELKKAHKVAKEKIQKLEKKEKESNEEIERIRDRVKELTREEDVRQCVCNELHGNVVRRESAYSGATMELDRLDASIERMDRSLKEIEGRVGSPCSECGVTIIQTSIPFMTESLRQTREKLLEEFRGKQQEVKVLMDDLERLKEKKFKALEALNESKDLRGEMDGLQEKLRNLTTRVERDAIFREVCVIENTLKDLEINKDPFEVRYEERKKDHDEYLSRIEACRRKLKEKIEISIGVKFWVDAFSASGIQSFILENTTAALNDRIEKYLGILSDGSLGASFDTVTKLKSGELREKFKLNAWNRYGAQDYSMLSGGEKRRIDWSTSLALSDIQRDQSTRSLDLLILDEVLVGLDEQGRSDVLGLIKKMYPDRPVFVISHDDLQDSMFSVKWSVSKVGGKTQVLR